MPDVAMILRVAHALAGLLLLTGLIGRWIALGHAGGADDIPSLRTSLAISSRFERMVIIGFGAVLLLGVATAIAQGRPLLGPLQGAPVDWLFVSLLLFVSTIPLVNFVFLPRGRVFDAALKEAITRGAVTDDLRAAFHDPAVHAAHAYELGAMVVIFILMIAKPF